MKLKNIKDQMNKREIQPSSDAWEKLSARLDEKEKKPVRWVYWMSGVAAAILIGFFLFPMLTTTVNETTEQLVVEQEDVDLKELNTNDAVVLENNIAPEVDQIEESNTTDNKSDAVNSNQKKSYIAVNKTIEVQKESTEKTNPIINKKDVINNEIIIDNQIEESIALNESETIQNEVEIVKSEPLTPSQEADLLLEQALQNQSAQSVVASKSVNATMLLLETEWDIESDKRHRIQNSIQDGLNFLKAEAVAIIDK